MANFSSSGLVLLIFIVVFTALCGGFIGLRFWAARLSGRSFCADDGFVVFAYANAVALGGVAIWSVCNGLGKSTAVLTADEIVVAAKLVMASNVCWLLSSVFVKLSILWMFKRIFTTRYFQRQCWFLIGVTACYGIAFLPVYLTNCEPIDQLWNPIPTGHCRNFEISDFATIGINIVLDVAILILPLPPLWKLQLPTRKKIIVTLMFSLGLATISIMMWRIAATIRVRGDPDFTKHLTEIGLISFFELWFGILVACIPNLGPLYQTYVRPMTKSSSSNTKGSYILDSTPSRGTKRGDFESAVDRRNIELDMWRSSAPRSEEHLVPPPAVTTDIASLVHPMVYPASNEQNTILVKSDIILS